MVTGTERPLPYPLTYPLTIEEVVTDDTPLLMTLEDIFPSDPDEQITVAFRVSLNEYVALASCVDVGRDIAYGTGTMEIWWIWARAIMATFCDQVLECITTTPEIQNAITQYAQSGSVTPTTPENAAILASELVNNPAGCDNDVIFGMCKQLVEFVDNICEDILQQVVTANIAGKALAYLISAIPVVESLPLDEAVGFGDWLADVIYNAYLAASTVTLRDEVSCALFCMTVDNNCVLSMQDARDYFYQQLGVTLDTSDPLSFINDLIAENLVGNATFYGMFTVVFQMFSFGEVILGNRFETFLRIVNSFYNDPDPDWSSLCDCGWTWTQDFHDATHSWIPSNNGFDDMAVWSSGNGWLSVDGQWNVSNYWRVDNIKSPTIAQTHIDSIKLTYNLTKSALGTGTNQAVVIVAVKANTSEIRYDLSFDDAVTGDGQEHTLIVNDDTIVGVRLLVRSSQQTTALYGGACRIVQVEITGTGTNPF